MAPPYPLIADALRRGSVIPFLGAGASIGSRVPDQIPWLSPEDDVGKQYLPTGRELSSYLATQTNLPKEEGTDLPKVAQYYDLVGGRTALLDRLREIFDRDYTLPRVHEFLANTAAKAQRPLLVVTTNYDDLLERAYNKRGIDYALVVHATNEGDTVLVRRTPTTHVSQMPANKLDVDPETQHIVYKIHGSCERTDPTSDQYVITEDDYIEFLSRMVKNKAVPAVFAVPFRQRHFLFLGYGLADWNFRVVFNRIGQERQRQKTNLTSWAVQRKPSKLEERFWQQRGVEVYDQTLDDFIAQLERK